MASEPSAALRAFLRDRISSYEELGALLLLAREPERSFSDAEVAEALNASVEPIAAALRELESAGDLLEARERSGALCFRFAPRSARRRELVAELSRLQIESRLTVVQLMSANALERVRGAAMRRLVDAFRLERPKR